MERASSVHGCGGKHRTRSAHHSRSSCSLYTSRGCGTRSCGSGSGLLAPPSAAAACSASRWRRPLRPPRRPSPAPSGTGPPIRAASKDPFSAYHCAASSSAAAASTTASPIPAVKEVRGGGIWPGAVNPHCGVHSSPSLPPPPPLSLAGAGQQWPCSRCSRQPWRAGPGTHGGRGPAFSARTGGRREARRGDQTGRAPHHAASAPAIKGRGALRLLLRNALVTSGCQICAAPALRTWIHAQRDPGACGSRGPTNASNPHQILRTHRLCPQHPRRALPPALHR